MVYTITLNPAIDHTVYVDRLVIGGLNRTGRFTYNAGGKGINVSKMLNVFHTENKAVTVIAGKNGEAFKERCYEAGLDTICWAADGETRENTKIVDLEHSVTTELNEPGPAVTEELLDQILNDLLSRALPGDIVVLTGSLPKGVSPETYGKWAAALAEKNVKVFLDASGEALRLGLQAGVYAAKPNRLELEQLLNKSISSEEEIISAGQKLLSQNLKKVIVSLGEKGAYYFEEGYTYYIPPMDVPVLSTVGAGDSMVAALIYADLTHKTAEETAKLVVAAASACISSDSSDAVSMQRINILCDQVKITEI